MRNTRPGSLCGCSWIFVLRSMMHSDKGTSPKPKAAGAKAAERRSRAFCARVCSKTASAPEFEVAADPSHGSDSGKDSPSWKEANLGPGQRTDYFR